MFNVDSNSPRPHCAKCGAYLDKAPDNAFGWCGACQAWAQMGGLQPQPSPQPAVPYPYPLSPPMPWPPGTLVVTCGGRMSPNPSWLDALGMYGSTPMRAGLYVHHSN